MTTLATFSALYRSLALTGVTSLTTPPLKLDTASMPAKWVDTVGIDEDQLRAKGVGGERTLRCRMVVVVAVMGQDTQAERWADAQAMVDTVNAGIKTVAEDTTLWRINLVPNFGDVYLAVVAEIEQSEWSI
jgi:hypothetical protein